MRPSSISFDERELRDLAADAVERREHDRLRRVVDDEVDAGQVLERADVAALAADDPALHVVGGKLDERDRRLGGVAGRDALESVGDEVPGAALGLGARLLLESGARGGRARAGSAPRTARAGAPSPRSTVMPEIRSSSRELALLRLLQLLLELLGVRPRGRRRPARGVRAPSACGRSPRPCARTRSSIFMISARRSATSGSISARSWTASSRASICASRRSRLGLALARPASSSWRVRRAAPSRDPANA